ncbi:MAG: hypothetical protein QXY47_06190 [Thermoplasmata archaeon]
MLTKEEIKEIIKDSALAVLLSEHELETVVEEIYSRYGERKNQDFSCIYVRTGKEEGGEIYV